MSEGLKWKGLWECKKCGAIEAHPGTHRPGVPFEYCSGEMVPHDRRAPDPEKQELVGALKGLVNIPALRHILGIRHTVDCDCAFCRARAILKKYEKE